MYCYVILPVSLYMKEEVYWIPFLIVYAVLGNATLNRLGLKKKSSTL
jgi:hypothetical protein